MMFSSAIEQKVKPSIDIDKYLLFIVMILVSLGALMIVSTSVDYAESKHLANSFHFVHRHFVYLGVALLAGIITLMLPSRVWHQLGPWCMLLSIVLLMMVLMFGKEVNYSKRWLTLGPVTLQAAEVVKLFVVVYMAGYLVRRTDELQTQIIGFVKPLLLVSIIVIALVLQPDFGSVAVIMATTLCMMFLAGARLWQFIALSCGVGVILFYLAISESYRLMRLKMFLDPWQDPQGDGYQLIQSLIAYGRGGWFGQGLGESVQKLLYLPEAHNDFVFAVYAEEFGFVGVVLVILCFVLFFYRGMAIARKALINNNPYGAYLCNGITLWLTMQAIVNIGVSSGALPTKGLTLPFISYGGNSLVICVMAVAMLLRVDYETQLSLKKGKRK